MKQLQYLMPRAEKAELLPLALLCNSIEGDFDDIVDDTLDLGGN